MKEESLPQNEAQLPGVGSRNGKGLHIFSLANPPPKPVLREQEDYPNVKCWYKVDYSNQVKAKKRGETDGKATSVKTKWKPGRPPRSLTQDMDDHLKHFYLEHKDGTPVSKKEITAMSLKARMTWEELHMKGMAPEMFGKITKVTWEFYWYSMAALPKFDFILLCEYGEWKLRKWSVNSYFSWMLSSGIRTSNAKLKMEVLNNPDLIKIDPIDNGISSKGNPPQDNSNNNNVTPEIEETSVQPMSVPTLIMY